MKPKFLHLPRTFAAVSLVKTIGHFFPEFWKLLQAIADPRAPGYVTYPLPMCILSAMCIFLFKVGSRRGFDASLHTPEFAANLRAILAYGLPEMDFPEELPGSYAINDLLCKLRPEDISGLIEAFLKGLLRMRALESFRLQGKYMIAVDGTELHTFDKKHCDKCLTRSRDGEIYSWYHPVLEAKLITPTGMAFSIATEFIENDGIPFDPNASEDKKKQDCEIKAFYRLAEKLKRAYPHLPMCILLDGLYAVDPVFTLCALMGWSYLITFKEGRLPSVFGEYQVLKSLVPENQKSISGQGVEQHYRWVNGLSYQKHQLNALECAEIKNGNTTTFVCLTDMEITHHNIETLSKGGRNRWKIENSGFNTQKNGGYELEHVYSKDPVGMKVYYLLLQLAHGINQLHEKGLLSKALRETGMGIKHLTQHLYTVFTGMILDVVELYANLNKPIQIRFESG